MLSCWVMFNSLRPHGLQSARLLCSWDSPGKNTGVSSHFLLQGILPTQESNPGFPRCRQTLYCLRHQGSHTQKNYTKKNLNDLDNHDGVITHPESDILECAVKWALGSITTNKARGAGGILVELFQILKDDAVKVLHSTYQ